MTKRQARKLCEDVECTGTKADVQTIGNGEIVVNVNNGSFL
jgi:hypothetical protein